MRFDALKVDSDRVELGVWKPYIDKHSGHDYGIEMLTRPIGNPEFLEMVTKLEREARDPITGDIDADTTANIQWRAVVSTCFVAFRSSDGTPIEDQNGEELVYSPELGERIFRPENQSGYMHIFYAWLDHARQMQDFLVGSVGAVGKKSETTSNGRFSGEEQSEHSKTDIESIRILENSHPVQSSATSND